MNLKGVSKTLFILLLIGISYQNEALSEDLIYQGRQDASRSYSANTQPGSLSIVPVSYSTSYGPQFSPYASFVQSPYAQRTNNYQDYMQAPRPAPQIQMPGVSPYQSGYQPMNSDPFMASEVSPYSRYSPYIEVVGEGSHYTLGIDDVITIIVRNQPDFSGRFIVDPEGNVQYNFVGDIKAEGLTKDELKAEITSRLKKFIRYPEVAVMISEYRSKAIYIFGYVNRPGKFAMKGDQITIKEAIFAAGLPTLDGSLKRVYVVRPSQYTETGKAQIKKVNLKKLLQKGDSAHDFLLKPGDTLIVKQRYFDKFVNNFTRIVGPLFQAAAVYELGYGGHDGFLSKD